MRKRAIRRPRRAAEASFRVSDYDNTVVLRDEKLVAVAVGARYEISDHWALSFRYRYSDNDSTDPVFSYERSQFTLAAGYQFQP